MANASNKKDFQFAIANVSTEQFSVTPEEFRPKENVDVTIHFSFKLAAKEQMVGVFMHLSFHQQHCKLINLEVGCHFKVHPDTWPLLLDDKREKLKLRLHLALHLATITTGTARGVLHARLTGSPFAHLVLPAVDLTTMLKSDIELSLS
ncbi:MAG: hypothetical protein R2813_13620 [Flavobacteriales bacterium]